MDRSVYFVLLWLEVNVTKQFLFPTLVFFFFLQSSSFMEKQEKLFCCCKNEQCDSNSPVNTNDKQLN